MLISKVLKNAYIEKSRIIEIAIQALWLNSMFENCKWFLTLEIYLLCNKTCLVIIISIILNDINQSLLISNNNNNESNIIQIDSNFV